MGHLKTRQSLSVKMPNLELKFVRKHLWPREEKEEAGESN